MNGNIECAFIGRVVSVADLKTSAAGKPWLALKLAIGLGEDATQWVRTVCFGDTATKLAGSVEKGAKLYIEGTIRLDRWKNAEGEERSGLSVACWKAEKVGTSAIGRNRPPRGKPPPEGDDPAPYAVRSAGEQAARRDWQRPSSDAEVPF
jgi:single-strand DNA-binding protein